MAQEPSPPPSFRCQIALGGDSQSASRYPSTSPSRFAPRKPGQSTGRVQPADCLVYRPTSNRFADSNFLPGNGAAESVESRCRPRSCEKAERNETVAAMSNLFHLIDHLSHRALSSKKISQLIVNAIDGVRRED